MFARIKNSFKEILNDRLIIGLLVAVVLLSVGLMVYVGIALEPSEVQVVTHYTAFGPTNFYRTRWIYLLTFIVFAAIFMIVHVVTALKLHAEKGRSFTVGFLWLSIGMLLIAFAIMASILNVATL